MQPIPFPEYKERIAAELQARHSLMDNMSDEALLHYHSKGVQALSVVGLILSIERGINLTKDIEDLTVHPACAYQKDTVVYKTRNQPGDRVPAGAKGTIKGGFFINHKECYAVSFPFYIEAHQVYFIYPDKLSTSQDDIEPPAHE